MAGPRDDGTFAEDKAHHPSRKVGRDGAYWRNGTTWSTANALQRLSDASKNLTPEAYAKNSDYIASTAMDIWNNPHPKEY